MTCQVSNTEFPSLKALQKNFKNWEIQSVRMMELHSQNLKNLQLDKDVLTH